MQFAVRLLWSRGRGVAEFDGVRVPLTVRPDIPGLLEMTELDYLPGQCATVRERHDATRSLESHEVAAVREWLIGRTAAASDAVSGETTIVTVVMR